MAWMVLLSGAMAVTDVGSVVSAHGLSSYKVKVPVFEGSFHPGMREESEESECPQMAGSPSDMSQSALYASAFQRVYRVLTAPGTGLYMSKMRVKLKPVR